MMMGLEEGIKAGINHVHLRLFFCCITVTLINRSGG